LVGFCLLGESFLAAENLLCRTSAPIHRTYVACEIRFRVVFELRESVLRPAVCSYGFLMYAGTFPSHQTTSWIGWFWFGLLPCFYQGWELHFRFWECFEVASVFLLWWVFLCVCWSSSRTFGDQLARGHYPREFSCFGVSFGTMAISWEISIGSHSPPLPLVACSVLQLGIFYLV
jgi:hypothetical protein